jgi:hypothetical protein
MTVVAAIVTRHCTAHASDSFLTQAIGGDLKVVESQATKLVRVERHRGVIAYWGLARHPQGWDALRWLRAEVGSAQAHASPQAFADHLALSLNTRFQGLAVPKPVHRGFGLHFSAYEFVDGHWIPELFAIRNWGDLSYTTIHPDGFRVTRETYGHVVGTQERSALDAAPERRLAVHRALHDSPLLLAYCNGDPGLFMPLAGAVLNTFLELSKRRQAHETTSPRAHLALVSRPIEVVSGLIRDFSPPRARAIGGRTHGVAVTPGGIYHSPSGD